MCYPSGQEANTLGTKQMNERGHHKGHYLPSKWLRELMCETICSFIHSFTKCAFRTYEVPDTGSGRHVRQGTCPSCEAYILAGSIRKKTNTKKPLNKTITNYGKS